VVVIRVGSAADAAQIAAVQREGWFAAYEGIIAREVIDRATAPDDGARVRQTYRTRPWQKIIVAEAGERDAPGARVPARPGIVGYASYGPEVNVLTEPWPHPLTDAGRDGQTAELYALYVHPAWWSTGTGRALMDQVLGRVAGAAYQVIVLWVLLDNSRARRFYERAGFTPDGATNLLERLGGVREVRYRRTLGD
jgi:ribosomal protein S18 acetylase RimI-like enzyme